MEGTSPPVIFLAYANDTVVPAQHLRSLKEEVDGIRIALDLAEQSFLCEVILEPNATLGSVLRVFQNPRYRHRIAIFHYAGHANENQLLLESPTDGYGPVYAKGLAEFLGEQRGLQLVFLNGCATAMQRQWLVDSKCDAVIATTGSIDDHVAMMFATSFYRALGNGDGLRSAFNKAVAVTKANRGDDPRAVHWGKAPEFARQAVDWPWTFETRLGAEQVCHWNLPDAAGNPLFGLPSLPPLDLPPNTPFRHLGWFEREHAEVFFGRASQTREIYDRVTASGAPPILLYYGYSGVGKSSVLAAGLLPRLEPDYTVHYLRRVRELGLLGTLMQCFPLSPESPAVAWRQAEVRANAPLLLILDQAEEVFTRPSADSARELGAFVDALQAIFGMPDQRPLGRLILSFRKEWLPEFEARLVDARLPVARLFLESLDRRGVVAGIEGPTSSERLRAAYRLRIDKGLAEEIADDLVGDPESPIAPTLQILLTKFWQAAREVDDEHRSFTRDLYLTLKRDGLLLKDFLDQRLTALEHQRSEIVQSGLALDLLAYHTSSKGTALPRSEGEVLGAYAHVQDIMPELVQSFRDGYLLADMSSNQLKPVKGTRLAHDTLALLVRERFEVSDRPGQRARRILENRGVEWKGGGAGALLDEADLRIVEAGVSGMRARTDDEERLIVRSQEDADRRRVEAQRAAQALKEARLDTQRLFRVSIAQQLTARAQNALATDPELAIALTVEAAQITLQANEPILPATEQALRAVLWHIGLSGGEVVAVSAEPRDAGSNATQVQHLRHVTPVAVERESSLPSLLCREVVPAFIKVLSAHSGAPGWGVAFSPDGRWLAGRKGQTLRVWALTTQDQPAVVDFANPWSSDGVFDVAFGPDGRTLAAGSLGAAWIWDVFSRGFVAVHHGTDVNAVAISSDLRWLACAGWSGSLRLWRLDDPGLIGSIVASAKRSDGSWAGAMRPIISETKSVSVGQQSMGDIRGVAFSSDSRWLAAGGERGPVRIWNLASTKLAEDVVSLPRSLPSLGLALSCQDCLAAVGSNGSVDLWNLTAPHPAETRASLHGHVGDVSAVAFSADGLRLATGGADCTVRLWDLTAPDIAGSCVVIGEHKSPVLRCAFSPDGRWLATNTDSGDTRMWLLRVGDLMSLAGLVGRNLAVSEWQRYFGGQAYHRTFPGLDVPRDPDEPSGRAISGP